MNTLLNPVVSHKASTVRPVEPRPLPPELSWSSNTVCFCIELNSCRRTRVRLGQVAITALYGLVRSGRQRLAVVHRLQPRTLIRPVTVAAGFWFCVWFFCLLLLLQIFSFITRPGSDPPRTLPLSSDHFSDQTGSPPGFWVRHASACRTVEVRLSRPGAVGRTGFCLQDELQSYLLIRFLSD